jgi:aspartate racemase
LCKERSLRARNFLILVREAARQAAQHIMSQPTNHIGIVGVSPEGCALFYRLVTRCAGHMRGPHEQPRLSVHNEPLAAYIDCIRRDDWHGVGKLLRKSADILARCGAGFCLTPDNAVQHGVQLAEVGSPIPWLTIPELVGAEVARDKRRTVGILGTKLVTRSSTYQTHLGLRGIQVHAPSEGEAERLDRIIFEELIYGQSRPESHDAIMTMVQHMHEGGCEAVILASSELPLVISEDNCPLPIYDSSEILAQAAVARTTPGT